MHSIDPEVVEVRPEERLDVSPLASYLRDRLPNAEGPLTIRQFGGGHANLTYLLAFGEHEYVLKRPPLGPVPTHAHDMRREHAVLSRLYAGFPLAPQAYLLCTDHNVIGCDFVIEERKRGVAIRRDLPEDHNDSAFCTELGNAIVDTLAALHRVDVAAAGLRDLGHPEGYVARQLDGWIARWEAARTAETADASVLTAWLREGMPNSRVVTIVHNDFKLDNMLLDPADPSRITALLDWDMCTIGDPLMDVGYMLALWPQSDDPREFRLWGMPTWHDGFATRAQALARYAERTGFDISRTHWYHVFNVFRFAAILQQIYKRYDAGQTHDERFAVFGTQANTLIRVAAFLVQRGD